MIYHGSVCLEKTATFMVCLISQALNRGGIKLTEKISLKEMWITQLWRITNQIFLSFKLRSLSCMHKECYNIMFRRLGLLNQIRLFGLGWWNQTRLNNKMIITMRIRFQLKSDSVNTMFSIIFFIFHQNTKWKWPFVYLKIKN